MSDLLDEIIATRFAVIAIALITARILMSNLTYPGSLLLRGMQRRVFLLEMRDESRRIRHGDAHRYVEGRRDDAGTDLRRFKSDTCTASAKSAFRLARFSSRLA